MGKLPLIANDVAPMNLTRCTSIFRIGKYTYKIEDGTVYEGEWDRGLRNGKGRASASFVACDCTISLVSCIPQAF
jgi:hypothetical protein